ncbi:beta-N-acetylhexosaminidase [Niabella aurantiaca]|uniref:beta-N-acetylhexosaminidase n=1 Tax=Niabella aurantiaca TaxID=379900 RepID=UPI00036382CD|nr:beta-N-acetylhexosaminidase [Niabella aurantiaca]
MVKIKLYLLVVLFLPVSFTAKAQGVGGVVPVSTQTLYNLIPRPVELRTRNGEAVHLTPATKINAAPFFAEQAVYLKEQLLKQCGLALPVETAAAAGGENGIWLQRDASVNKMPGAYVLEATEEGVIIRANDRPGIIYGIQTLLQVLPLSKAGNIALPLFTVTDHPRFAYRGMHLDVSRHFFSVAFIKKYIDYLCHYKFNVFHWHLTDDQGWRIEIKSYPRLTQIGAWRDSTLLGHSKDRPARYDGRRYGGYYTQEQVREIVRYAGVRGITVIPEIDVPGHCRAAIAAYPELSTGPDSSWTVATEWGTFNRLNNVLAPTPATFRFLKQVFNEVAALFPAPYIHIGGDECSKKWWQADSATQAFIRAHGLKDEAGLQAYFVKQVVCYLKARGKKAMGWEEAAAGVNDTSLVVMNWQEKKKKTGPGRHKMIMTPIAPLYFNCYQSKRKDTLAIFGYNSLEAVYAYEPVPKKMNGLDSADAVLGAQGNLWTEYIRYPSTAEYMIFPRMTALSEVLWSEQGHRDFRDFKKRLKMNALPRYRFWDAGYFGGDE